MKQPCPIDQAAHLRPSQHDRQPAILRQPNTVHRLPVTRTGDGVEKLQTTDDRSQRSDGRFFLSVKNTSHFRT